MIIDFFKYAFTNLTHRKLRSWLTMLGIFIGIASVVALVSLGQGLTKYIDDEAQKLGNDKLFIMPKGQFGAPGTGGAVKLTDDDFDAVKDISGVANAARMAAVFTKMEFADSVYYRNIYGFKYGKEYELFEELFGTYGIEEGRDLKNTDTYRAVMGVDYFIKNIFDKKLEVGDDILINNATFQVVGRWERIGNPDDDANVIIPIDTFRTIFPDKGNEIDYIYIKVADATQINEMEDKISKKLRYHRNLREGEEDFTVQSPQQLLETFNTVFLVVQAVLVGIAGISLVVGGIGIMNTMYTAVLERTREIGVMKSIGARNSDILTLFMIESGVLGLAGGAIGIALGMGIAKLVEFIAGAYLGSSLLKAYFPWYLIVGSLVFAFVVGIISGTLPARQASKLKPVDALRYE